MADGKREDLGELDEAWQEAKDAEERRSVAEYAQALAYERAQEEFMRKRQGKFEEDSTHTTDRKKEGKVRIGNITAAAIVFVALAFDGAQILFELLALIPILGIGFIAAAYLVSFCAFIWLGMWFAYLRVNYFGGRKAAMKILSIFGALVIELIPFISMFPTIMASALIIIVATRIEDTVGDTQQLQRTGKRRTDRREKLAAQHERERERARRADERGGGGTRRQERQGKKQERQERSLANKEQRESLGMGARALLGIGKKPITNDASKQGKVRRDRQRGQAGYYDQRELANDTEQETIEEGRG